MLDNITEILFMIIFAVGMFLIGVTIALIVIGTFALPGYLISKNITCPAFAESVELTSKYNFWGGGCYVEVQPNEWVKRDDYKRIDYQGVNLNK